MSAGFSIGKNPLLNVFWQSDITVAVTVDMHEHCAADKECVLMNSLLRWARRESSFVTPDKGLRPISCFPFPFRASTRLLSVLAVGGPFPFQDTSRNVLSTLA